MTLSSGSRLGSYEILAPLGAGGMGEVYRARDTRLDRTVAIKVLPSEFSRDADRLGRFQREARATSALNHPNIVTIHEVGEVDSTSFIVMELVEGTSLRDELVDGPLPVRKLLAIAVQIADGLARAHAAGIVHRDLKPENVMIASDGLVKILDFGLAKRTEVQGVEQTHAPTASFGTEAGVLMGTVRYMSPEQASGKTVDFRSDQFSLGLILYEMSTGVRAFEKGTTPETLSAIIREDPRPIGAVNPAIPTPLRWIVERCLAKEPRDRYSSSDDLARDLATVRDRLAELSVAGEPLAAVQPTRSRIPLVAAVSVILALGLLAGRYLWKAPSPSPPRFHRLSFRLGLVWSARFSPDGQTVLYAASWEGRPLEVFTTRLGSPESRPVGLANTDLRSISPSGELAILLRLRAAMGPNSLGTLARVPLAGGAPREILEDVCEADWMPDGKSLAVVRLAGAKRRLEFPIGKPVYETSGWITSLRVSPAGDRVSFAEWTGFRGSVVVVDRKGQKQTLAGDLLAPWGTAWSPGGDEVWFAAIEEGDTGQLVAVTLSGRKRLVERLPGGLGLFDLSRDGRALLARYSWRTGISGLFPGGSGERDLSWLDESQVADISADGRAVLFSESGRGVWPGSAVYLRKIEDAAPIRLGEGTAMALSPDGKWALTVGTSSAPALVLLPLGPGEPRALPNGGIESFQQATWFPSADRILFAGVGKNGGVRCYVQDVLGGQPRPVTPEGTSLLPGTHTVSPDGRSFVAAGPDQRISVYGVDGGKATEIPSLGPGDVPVRWNEDGRSIFAFRFGLLPVRIDRISVATGVREPWKNILPSDPSGIMGLRSIHLTPSGRWYAYSYSRMVSDLYLAEPVK